MAYVIAAPDMLAAAATDVATIGSNVSAAHMVAAAPTVALIPAAADEVSAGIAHLFTQHAQGYQAQAAQAAVYHEQFVQHLTASAGSYAASEAANVAVLQPLIASVSPFISAIGALTGQLLNSLTGFLNLVLHYALGYLLLVLLPFLLVLAQAINLVIYVLKLGGPYLSLLGGFVRSL
jgi:hypothetical protein